MQKKIVLIGAGNIGRRHLQAIAKMHRELRVTVVEPESGALSAAMGVLAKAPWVSAATTAYIQAIPTDGADLAIVATDARSRRPALSQLLDHAPPRALLLEKVLFQRRKDLDEVALQLEKLRLPTWVNCGRRGFSLYDQLRAQSQGKKLTVEIQGSRWGICCNGIHFLDIVGYVLDDFLEYLSGEELEERPEQAKRPGCMELYGTIRGRFSRGTNLTLRCFRESGTPMTISFCDGLQSWVVDETNACLTHIGKDGKKNSQPFAMLNVSSMDYLYSEILDTGSSRLTPYAFSASQHRLFLDVIRQRLGLSNEGDEPCPIT